MSYWHLSNCKGTENEFDKICIAKYVLFSSPKKLDFFKNDDGGVTAEGSDILNLDVNVTAEGSNILNLDVNVDVRLPLPLHLERLHRHRVTDTADISSTLLLIKSIHIACNHFVETDFRSLLHFGG